jgi:radical SAM superfamily enzyme YgiQ (UPF0313 family)
MSRPLEMLKASPRQPGFESDANIEDRVFAPLGRGIRALLVWPRIPPSFWSFAGNGVILPEKACIPPLGLLTVAALCPKDWALRLIDCTFEDMRDDDLQWANLILVSGMQVQREDLRRVLRRARAAGKRTMVGGPYASSEPESLLDLADHVVMGEPDNVFAEIANDLETGAARRLYTIHDKPDLTTTPAPRFDLLKIDNYSCMAVQFSRGCPFECEFCDIITIYGRKPRTKHPSQVTAELDALRALGWRKQVFIVDDNFIGNHKHALGLAQALEAWQIREGYPFMLGTEASMDLAQRPELVEAMVRANFWWIFVGVESPSKESLKETRKFQNLRNDPLESIHILQEGGLWITAGFIIGFDSDTADIYKLQEEFIDRAAIPWAMLGFLQAPPTTPLYARLRKEGRLVEEMTSNFNPPNFRTVLPFAALLKGMRETLQSLYKPSAYYDRAFRSLQSWNIRDCQRPPHTSFRYSLMPLIRSLWLQGVVSSYRREWWRFLLRLLRNWSFSPTKRWWGLAILISGHHFVRYAAHAASQLQQELQKLERSDHIGVAGPAVSPTIAPAALSR